MRVKRVGSPVLVGMTSSAGSGSRSSSASTRRSGRWGKYGRPPNRGRSASGRGLAGWPANSSSRSPRKAAQAAGSSPALRTAAYIASTRRFQSMSSRRGWPMAQPGWVTAPSDADDTSAAYLASTPRV